MVKLSRRRLFTLGLPAVAVAAAGAFIPSTIAAHAGKPRRQPELINFFQLATTPLDIRPKTLMRALQTYIDDYFFPVWGVRAQLHWSNKPQAGVWNVAFVDSEQNDDPGALAYHNFDPANNGGLPYAIVDVEASLEDMGSIGVPVSHELVEMLADPGTNNWCGVGGFDPGEGPDTEPTNTKLYALEVADPVERAYFKVDGVPLSDFVFPAYFEPWSSDGPVDYLGVISHPGQIAAGGYQIVRDHDKLSELTNFPQERRCNRFRRIWKRHTGDVYRIG
jgi:hypothetical protein